MDIEAFVRAEVDADEAWALACSRPPGEDDAEVPGGVHWQWMTADEKTVHLPALPEDLERPTVTDVGTLAWLVTVEKWSRTDDEGESFEAGGMYSDGLHEIDVEAGAHIVRHNPARILAAVAAKRALLELVLADANANGGKNSGPWNQVMRLLALEYQDRPGYRKSWAPR